jgi:hypothetical protein
LTSGSSSSFGRCELIFDGLIFELPVAASSSSASESHLRKLGRCVHLRPRSLRAHLRPLGRCGLIDGPRRRHT